MKFTVDASVVVKWYVSEAHSEEARLLLGHRLERYAPDFVLVELANVFWKKARLREIGDPHSYFQELSRIRQAVALISSADLIERASHIAAQLDHPVYDCLYIACAEDTESTLITADRKLAAIVADRAVDVEVQDIGVPEVADKIAAAATALVVTHDKIAELVAAYDRHRETSENILASITEGEAGSPGFPEIESLEPVDSPALRRFAYLIAELDDEERIDLLALGLLGQGHSGAEWQPAFQRACGMIDDFVQKKSSELPVLSTYWRAGYERLTGISI